MWTAAGAMPRDVELIIGKEFSPQVHSRIMQAANKCAKTAEKIWTERNKENEAWINSIPELRARKAEANRKQWPAPRVTAAQGPKGAKEDKGATKEGRQRGAP